MFNFVLLEVWEAQMQSGKQIWSMYIFIYAKNWLSFYKSLKWLSNMAKMIKAIS
jgi:hypothetical protein